MENHLPLLGLLDWILIVFALVFIVAVVYFAVYGWMLAWAESRFYKPDPKGSHSFFFYFIVKEELHSVQRPMTTRIAQNRRVKMEKALNLWLY